TRVGSEVADRNDSAGKNQLALIQQLWVAQARTLPSGRMDSPCGNPAVSFRISVRVPPERLRSIRLSATPLALSVSCPVSLSEPAIQFAFPVRVTSLMAAPPLSAVTDC